MPLPSPLILSTTAAVAVLIAGPPAAAQTWRTLPMEGGTAAAVQWESGAAIIGRCQDGAFNLLLSPVHEFAPYSRSHFRLSGDEWEQVNWATSEGARALFSRTPARMARKIAAGGTLELRFTEEGASPVLYQLEITEESAPLLGVLADCGLPHSDPRDDLQIIDSPEWVSRPRGSDLARHYPNPDRGWDGAGSILCIMTNTGVPTDCEITYESPSRAGFGEATRALARRFRLHRDQAVELEGWLVSITVRWRIG